MTDASSLPPGFQVIHANRMEDLRRVVVWLLREHPLAPLENEIFLVQSNGIAQWLKLALAEDPAAGGDGGGLGIAAATQFLLPSRFVWQAYRTVLGADQVPEHSPFDKPRLLWRLYRLLPALCRQPVFAPLARFLEGPQPLRRRFQLAERLADLFDQYQVFRADWLADWAQGDDRIALARGGARALDEAQCWQPKLWRALLQDIAATGDSAVAGRAGVHQRFLAHMAGLSPQQRPPGLPRRLVVFGVSSLPQQWLEALDALGRCCQVLLCVHNPCEFYWADIVSDRELLRAERRRSLRGAPPLEALHGGAQALLATWGRQGRDYIRLLDRFDDPEHYRAGFERAGQRVDLFTSFGGDTLLRQIQEDVRCLRPLSESRDTWPALDPRRDHSLVFHVAHGPQREVEILHDQLLAVFDADPGLRPRDVIVMVPDINRYAPHIEAVFGRYGRDDRRCIPFSISDQGRRQRQPLLVALEQLLSLPESRFGLSDVLSLLEVPALRQRFGIDEADLPRLHAWAEGANVRWGLDAEQREALDLPAGLERNSWRFGLRRMLLGYAVGSGEAWQDIEPYPEIGGLEASLVGVLDTLLQRLRSWWRQLREDVAPRPWLLRLAGLRADFFGELEGPDLLLFTRLQEAAEAWLAACEEACVDEALPLSVVRELWLEGLEEQGLQQRFLAGRVNFATLLPMRAIPFRRICLLGMNDGDYPRSRPPPDFDLMALDYRPGDRSRREDDRYLFLEALLSARDQLYISWAGRSQRDNAERPPSVLVAQLRDHIDAGWRLADTAPGALASLSRALTTEHPLQPFSPAYFPAANRAGTAPAEALSAGRLFTCDDDWRQAHEALEPVPAEVALPFQVPEEALQLTDLSRFLRDPPRAFHEQRLQVFFREQAAAAEDSEVFTLDGLGRYTLQEELIREAVLPAADADELDRHLQQLQARMARRGDLGLATTVDWLGDSLAEPMADMHRRLCEHRAAWPDARDGLRSVQLQVDTAAGAVVLVHAVDGVRADAQGALGRIDVQAGDLLRGSGSGKSYHYRNMLAGWLGHLAAQLAWGPLTTVLVARSTDVCLPPLPAEEAEALLRQVLLAWMENMTRPLPVLPDVAMAWLDGLEGKAGSEERAMERAAEAFAAAQSVDAGYLRRSYADFAALWCGGEFVSRANALYRPLWQMVKASAAPRRGGSGD